MKKLTAALTAAALCCTAYIPGEAHAESSPSKFTATFIQGWYCRDWTLERWEEEFSAASEAGFRSLILQSVYDIVRGECSGRKEDPSAYTAAQSSSMFPAEADYHSSQNSGDALELALKAAKATDMTLWIGTVNDDMWWNYGWGAPSSYLEDWSSENARLSADLMTQIWERYGGEFSDQIAGWYYTNEVWNIDSACQGSDGGEYARIIGENIGRCVAAAEELAPEKPLMISPFYNKDISSPEQFTQFLSDLISASGLRPIDVYAGQDDGGRNYSPEVIRQWALAQKEAVDGRLRFWVNTESFGEDRSPKPIEELRENYCAVADLAQENVIFSWDHYYAQDSALSSQFSRFSAEYLMGDVNSDGAFDLSDLVAMQSWLLARPEAPVRCWQAGDFTGNGRLEVFDLILMREAYLAEPEGIVVTDSQELIAAMQSAKAGDVIKVAPGTYQLTGSKAVSDSEGTAEAPIVLKALDPKDPPVLTGTTTEHDYVLHITGDYWIVEDLVCTNAQKGIVLDNSDHTILRRCELHTLGAEAVALRDGSSYCTVDSCYIHDTGLVKPGYGEGVYVGSAKSTTGFDYKCDYNTITGCTFKNVAAEHIDVKEYTTGTEICGCTFYGDGMTGENYAGSFVDLQGNDCYVHDNVGYRDGNVKIVAAFEIHEQVEGWGLHQRFENNTVYMDQPYGAEDTSRRMYVVDGWSSDFSVKDNKVDYGSGLVPADSWEFYNSDYVTYL
ncbi:MAG: DUF4434 domain-containing protein [Ruminococcus sp.]|nr:DUF4434 domain-containing protein [Ruminococcus sp.]